MRIFKDSDTRDLWIVATVVLLCLACILVPVGIVVSAWDSETIELRKADWKCTESTIESTTQVSNMITGKGNVGIVITPGAQKVCVQWRKRDAE
jgi:hypothetical protein